MAGRFRFGQPGFAPPPNACDSHMHIIGPDESYPFVANASYRTLPAETDDYLALARTLGLTRAVVVQPSFYGTDNRCTLAAIAKLNGAGVAARGVAVIDPRAIGDAELATLHDAGVRGARLNKLSIRRAGGPPLEDELGEVDRRIAELGWHIQLFVDAATLPKLARVQNTLRAPLVIDHFGMLRPELLNYPPFAAGHAALLEILANGGWVKLSGSYRFCDDPASPSLAALARSLAKRGADRLLWGSDWPHTLDNPQADPELALPFRDLASAALLNPLADWFEPAQCRRVLVDNPARCYAFGI